MYMHVYKELLPLQIQQLDWEIPLSLGLSTHAAPRTIQSISTSKSRISSTSMHGQLQPYNTKAESLSKKNHPGELQLQQLESFYGILAGAVNPPCLILLTRLLRRASL